MGIIVCIVNPEKNHNMIFFHIAQHNLNMHCGVMDNYNSGVIDHMSSCFSHILDVFRAVLYIFIKTIKTNKELLFYPTCFALDIFIWCLALSMSGIIGVETGGLVVTSEDDCLCGVLYATELED